MGNGLEILSNAHPETVFVISVLYAVTVILYTRLVFIDELAHGAMPGRCWARVGRPEASMPRIVFILATAAALTPITMFVLLGRHAFKLKA